VNEYGFSVDSQIYKLQIQKPMDAKDAGKIDIQKLNFKRKHFATALPYLQMEMPHLFGPNESAYGMSPV